MLFISFLLCGLIFSFLIVYFHQYLGNGIIWWTIPLLFIVGFFIGIVLFLLFARIKSYTQKKGEKIIIPRKSFYFWVARCTGFIRALLNLKLVVEGREKIPSKGSFIFVGNHQSNLDSIISIYTFRKNILTYIMKREVLKIPIIGRFLYGAGFIPIDRKNNRQGLEVIIQAIKRVECGYPICIYPEGTRSKGPEMNDFHDGSFRIAVKAKVPIVIVAIDNAYKVKSHLLFKRTKILIRVCGVLEPEDYQDLNTKDISQKVRQIIQDNLDEARAKYKWLR